MKLLRNSGTDRVLDELCRYLDKDDALDYVSRGFFLPAFREIAQFLQELRTCRLILQDTSAADLGLYGGDADRATRNKLNHTVGAVRSSEARSSRT